MEPSVVATIVNGFVVTFLGRGTAPQAKEAVLNSQRQPLLKKHT
jgi:hypothetical protein